MNVQLKCIYSDHTQDITIREDDIVESCANKGINSVELMRIPDDLLEVSVVIPSDILASTIKSEDISVTTLATGKSNKINVQRVSLNSTIIDAGNWSLRLQKPENLIDNYYVITANWNSREEDHQFAIAHHDDCNGNIDSHEVSLWDKTYGAFPDLSCICGYGENYEKAFDEFLTEFNKVMHDLCAFQNKLNASGGKNVDVVDVDCLGLPLE